MFQFIKLFLIIVFLGSVWTLDTQDEIQSLPYCLHESVSEIDRLIYVSTIDGRVTALNSNENGSILWSVQTGDTEMLSSTIQNRELTNNGQWVRMIPSLSGSLYKFDGETVNLVPVTADELLTSSFRYSNDLVFAGGKEIFTYGVGLKSGKVFYTCDVKGCQNETNVGKAGSFDEDLLIIQKRQQTVHAVTPDSGVERWNFSVGQHDLKVTKSSQCHSQEKYHLDLDIKVVLPEGLIFAVAKDNENNVLWTQKLNAPIVNVWQWSNGELKAVEVFTGSQWSWSQNNGIRSPSIYIGMHNKQLYIQESANMQSMANSYVYNYKQNLLEHQSKFPKIPWKPFPVASSAVTALGLVDENPSEIVEVGTTSIAVLYASKYINGNGFYLYAEDDLKRNDEIVCNESTDDSSNDNETVQNSDFQFFDDEDAPVQIMIVSLSFWWKEVVIISITAAVVLNFIFNQMFHNRSDIREGIQQEIIVMERHIQIPVDNCCDKSHSIELTPNGEFESRFLNDFKLLHCLGKGGFGMVFEAQNKVDECRYAVKQISLPDRNESRERVMREVKALAKLDHRNIVRYYNSWLEFPPANWKLESKCSINFPMSTHEYPTEDSVSVAEAPGENYESLKNDYDDKDDDSSFIVFEDDIRERTSQNILPKNISSSNTTSSTSGIVFQDEKKQIVKRVPAPPERRMYLYIQMQLCQKESLKDWMLHNTTRNLNHIKVIFEQILSAVEYVHLQGLIHRDLKPSNIFFSLDGEIKIGDFGLVTAITDDINDNCDTNFPKKSNKRHTHGVGTQLYMSPEQVKGSSYNYKVDIYSLGIIFFELLIPFSTEMERHCTLANLRANKYPDNFQKNYRNEYNLLQLMLANEPEKRPTTYGIRARPPFSHKIENTKWHFELPLKKVSISK